MVKYISMVICALIFGISGFSQIGLAKDGKTVSEKVTSSVSKAVDLRQTTQKNLDKWVTEKEKLTAQFLTLEKKNKALTNLNQQLTNDRNIIRDKVQKRTKRLNDVARISKELSPLLDQICQALEKMIAEGPPMLLAERKHRLIRLKKIIIDPEISISEQYRKTMEALFVEAEYGNTIEVYQETILLGEETVLADIFRLGRLSLFCKTPDGKQTGYYDLVNQKWQILDHAFNAQVAMAMEMGAKRRSIDFVSLPLGKVVTP